MGPVIFNIISIFSMMLREYGNDRSVSIIIMRKRGEEVNNTSYNNYIWHAREREKSQTILILLL